MQYDVVVVGSGNAGFSAAHAANERGARVLLLEKAPQEWAGGNSYFTQGSFRTAMSGLDEARELLHDPHDERLDETDLPGYSAEDFLADIQKVTQGRCDPYLASTLAHDSNDAMRWLKTKGIPWELHYTRRAFRIDGRWRFWGGGGLRVVGQGKGLIQRHTEAALEAGTDIRYGSPVTGLLQDSAGAVVGVRHGGPDGEREVEAGAVVLASGGFGANPQWRAAYLGQSWDLAMVRGTPHNTGDGLAIAIDAGAQPYGHWSGCHAVSWDPAAHPDRGDREETNALTRSSYMLGLLVNNRGQRFLDEGANFRTVTYAKYGGEVLRQPEAEAFQLFDSRTRGHLNPEYDHTASPDGVALRTADSVGELAEILGIDRAGLESTVAEFNASVSPDAFDPSVLDGKHTTGLAVPKSNWAVPLDSPPFYGLKVACGITFTYGGLRTTTNGEVVSRAADRMPGLFAAGEMIGGIFYHNYPGGAGLTSGTVFGRRAGRAAAAFAAR